MKTEKVSQATRDAWKIKPPCEISGECHNECPHLVECWGDDIPDDDEDEDEDWREVENELNKFFDHAINRAIDRVTKGEEEP